jgi:type VI protein secretion system component VasK
MTAPEHLPEADAIASGGNPASRWLIVGGCVAIVLALLFVLLAWQRAIDERKAAEDVGARVAAEMNRIEAEAQRIEREASR